MPGTWPQSGIMAMPAASASGERASCSRTRSVLPPRSVMLARASMATRAIAGLSQ